MMRYDIAFASDDNYVKILATAMASLLENNRDLHPLYIHILDDGISPKNRRKLIDMVSSYPVKMDFIEVQHYTRFLKQSNAPDYNDNYTTYARLWLPELVPDAERILYLDCDVLVLSSLRTLFNTDMHNKAVAGVIDRWYRNFIPQLPELNENSIYINAGVLLIDCKKWQTKNYTQRLLDKIHTSTARLSLADQDLLNITLQDDIWVLEPRYNLFYWMKWISGVLINRAISWNILDFNVWYSRHEYINACKHTVIMHYVHIRSYCPWKHSGNAFALWRKYAKKTPYNGKITPLRDLPPKETVKYIIDKLHLYGILMMRIYKR